MTDQGHWGIGGLESDESFGCAEILVSCALRATLLTTAQCRSGAVHIPNTNRIFKNHLVVHWRIYLVHQR